MLAGPNLALKCDRFVDRRSTRRAPDRLFVHWKVIQRSTAIGKISGAVRILGDAGLLALTVARMLSLTL